MQGENGKLLFCDGFISSLFKHISMRFLAESIVGGGWSCSHTSIYASIPYIGDASHWSCSQYLCRNEEELQEMYFFLSLSHSHPKLNSLKPSLYSYYMQHK